MKKQTFYRLTYELSWSDSSRTGWMTVLKDSPSKDVHEMRLKDYLAKAEKGYARNVKSQLIEETILDEWEEK